MVNRFPWRQHFWCNKLRILFFFKSAVYAKTTCQLSDISCLCKDDLSDSKSLWSSWQTIIFFLKGLKKVSDNPKLSIVSSAWITPIFFKGGEKSHAFQTQSCPMFHQSLSYIKGSSIIIFYKMFTTHILHTNCSEHLCLLRLLAFAI